LSSGGAMSAIAGLDQLAAMSEATPAITIMPGGGITADTIATLATRLHLTEVHASCSSPQPDPVNAAITAFGFQPPNARATDVNSVRALRAALDQIAASRPSGWTAA
ncbi:MAG: copper homeostasis protein CutC, partial [Deltaproteobacteria bacterium]